MSKTGTLPFLTILALAVFTSSCSLHSETDKSHSDKLPSTSATDSLSLSLPSVPDTITTIADRMAYYAVHYWDALNISDTTHCHNSDFLEQNFANFAFVLPQIPRATADSAAWTLLQKTSADTVTYSLLINIAEKYLYTPESPMYNDEIYRIFAHHVAMAKATSTTQQARAAAQVHDIDLNRTGTQFTEFAYTDTHGRNTSLRHTPVNNRLLLVFYDPDCDNCRETLSEMFDNPAITHAIRKNELTVLAIYTGPNHKAWETTTAYFPATWIVGYEPGTLETDDKISLPTLPAIYILDSQYTVLAKNLNLERLTKAII